MDYDENGEPISLMTFDLAKEYFKDENNQPYKLKDTWEAFFQKEIQCGIHSAIQDARATRDLYFKYLEIVKEHKSFSTCPIKITRTPREKWVFDPNDKCTCKKKEGQQNKTPFYVPKKRL